MSWDFWNTNLCLELHQYQRREKKWQIWFKERKKFHHTHTNKKPPTTPVWDFCRGSKELMTVPSPIGINHNERVDVLDIQPWNLLQVLERISEHVCQDDLANKVCMNRKRAFSNISCQVSNCVKWKRRDNYGRLIKIL